MSVLKKILNSTTIGIWGMKGYGKTYLSSILVNADNRRYVVLDTVGAYDKDCLIKDAVYIKAMKVLSSKEIRAIFNRWKIEGTRCLVFNVEALLSDELVEFSDILHKFILREGNTGVCVDEIGEYCPEGNTAKRYYSRELERVVRIGRNYGIKPYIMITQRPQQVAKKILDLCDTTIIFKLIHHRSRERVKALLGMSDVEFSALSNALRDLQVGQSVVVDENLNWYIVDWKG